MRSAMFRWSILLVQAMWFTVLMPGHTRGLIVLPGTDACGECDTASFARAKNCCEPTDDRANRSSGTSRNDRAPMPAKRVANCAVCFFAAHLSTSLVIPPQLPQLQRVGNFVERASRRANTSDVRPTYFGRAPPIDAWVACGSD